MSSNSKAKNTSKASPNNYTSLLGMLKRVRKPNGEWVFKLVWSRVLIIFSVLALFLWLVMGFVVYGIVKYHRNYEDFQLHKAFLLPFNMDAHRLEMSDYNFRLAKDMLASPKPDFKTVFENLHFSVARNPRNVEARLMLAEIYLLLMKKPVDATELLEGGLIYAKDNLKYLRMYIRLLMDQSEDLHLLQVLEKLMQTNTITDPELKIYVAMTLSSLYAMHGDFEKSKQFLLDFKLENTLSGIIRLSRNEWEQGKREEAIAIIVQNLSKFNNKEPLYTLLSKYYTVMNDFENARYYAILKTSENPLSLSNKLDYVTLLKLSGDTVRYNEEVALMYKQYRTDAQNLLLLANFAAENGDLETIRSIYDTALLQDFNIGPYALLLLETMLTAKDFNAAVAFSDDIIKEKPAWLMSNDSIVNCLRAIAYCAIGNTNMTDILVKESLDSNKITPKALLATARRFSELKAYPYAIKFLKNAVERFPKNQLALARLIQTEMNLGNSTNLDKNVFKLLNLRRPPRELVDQTYAKIASDRFIFASDRQKIMRELIAMMNIIPDVKTSLDLQNSDFTNDDVFNDSF